MNSRQNPADQTVTPMLTVLSDFGNIDELWYASTMRNCCEATLVNRNVCKCICGTGVRQKKCSNHLSWRDVRWMLVGSSERMAEVKGNAHKHRALNRRRGRERMQLFYCKRQLPYAVSGVTRLFLECRFEHSDTGALIVFCCRRQRNYSTTISCLRDLLLVPHGRSPPLPGLIVSSLGLAKTLLEDLGVLVLPCISIRTRV
jgi:hypothetical protein